MTIEWMPRSRCEEDGWRQPVASGLAPGARLDESDGVRGVRVHVHRRRLAWQSGLPQGWSRRSLLRVAFGLYGLYLLYFNIQLAVEMARAVLHSLWSPWPSVAAGVLGVAWVYRWLRLRPISGRRERDVVVTPVGLHTAGLVVPWSQVQEVVRFNFLFGPGRGGPGPRNFLAVRVRDFVGVRGLSQSKAGLANLTRRHLLVLAQTSELANPSAVALALERLVTDPVSRRLLTGPEGVRLLAEGPPPPPATSP